MGGEVGGAAVSLFVTRPNPPAPCLKGLLVEAPLPHAPGCDCRSYDERRTVPDATLKAWGGPPQVVGTYQGTRSRVRVAYTPRAVKRHYCRGCWVLGRAAEVSPPRLSYCNDDCVDTYLLWSGHSGRVRTKVEERDQGVCQACGLDTVALTAFLRWLRTGLRAQRTLQGGAWVRVQKLTHPRRSARARHVVAALGFPLQEHDRWGDGPARGRRAPTRWHADHIVPLADGGDWRLSNLRTLCVPCHKAVTKQWHGERSRRAS